MGLFLGAMDTGRCAIDVEARCLHNPNVRHFEPNVRHFEHHGF
jgi:hypothetical protein